MYWKAFVLIALCIHPPRLKADFTSGDESCPCLSPAEMDDLDPKDLKDERVDDMFGPNMNETLTAYGFGCAAHDSSLPACQSDICRGQETILPVPASCSNDFCRLNFCYVDPNNCNLLFRRSETFPHSNRFFSYATCWDVDSFTSNKRISAVSEKTYRVGFNHNSGGWLGAYSTTGQHFDGPPSVWSGPFVNFAIQGAMQARYLMNLTKPPDFLKNRSQAYFKSQSPFDLCVYATALGYLDFCLSQYTITNQRAATTDWLLLGSQDLFLVVQYDEGKRGLAGFLDKAWTIFLPFTPSAWAVIILLVIPILGALMVFHDYNHPGSAYPDKEDVIVHRNDGSHPDELVFRPVPFLRHLGRGVYIGLLSVMQQNYVHSVVTYAAQINLLGMSFFILTIIAVYTANLAAILTQDALSTSVGSLEDAVERNFRICSERKNLETVRALYPSIPDSQFVVDPPELGGDGLPGFNCADCKARSRVFDFLDKERADSDQRYCHAAFAATEDLEVRQGDAVHCNKTIVGRQLGSVQTGIPVNEAKSAELISFFLSLKNEGVFSREVLLNQPRPSCPSFQDGPTAEGEALNVEQLSGIWIVSGFFGLLGILVTWLQPKVEARQKRTYRPVHNYDQMGNKTNILRKDDDWINDTTVERDGKLILTEKTHWGTLRDKLSEMTSNAVPQVFGGASSNSSVQHNETGDNSKEENETRSGSQSIDPLYIEPAFRPGREKPTAVSFQLKETPPFGQDRNDAGEMLAVQSGEAGPGESGGLEDSNRTPTSQEKSSVSPAAALVDQLAGIFRVEHSRK